MALTFGGPAPGSCRIGRKRLVRCDPDRLRRPTRCATLGYCCRPHIAEVGRQALVAAAQGCSWRAGITGARAP